MKDMLYAVLALIAVIIGGYEIYSYISQAKETASNVPLFIGIFFILVAIVLGGMFMAGRVNRNEDIHVTE